MHLSNYSKIFALGLCTLLSLGISQKQASADACEISYSLKDINTIRSVFSEANSRLVRMAEIAHFASRSVLSTAQREALNSEYQAHMSFITELGQDEYPNTTERTGEFLDTVVNAAYLNVLGSQLQGSTLVDFQESANKATYITLMAVQKLVNCF